MGCRGLVLAALSVVETAMPQHLANDRGHKHTNGVSVVEIFLQKRDAASGGVQVHAGQHRPCLDQIGSGRKLGAQNRVGKAHCPSGRDLDHEGQACDVSSANLT